MIQKVAHKARLSAFSEIHENLKYWRSLPESARVSVVEILRRQRHGDAARLQRAARIIQRALG